METVAAETLSNDELASAIAEVETVNPPTESAASAAQAGPELVAVPVPGPGLARPRMAEHAAAPAEPPAPPDAPPPPEPRAAVTLPVPEQVLESARGPSVNAGGQGILWWVVDRALAVLNFPFEGLSPAARQALGLVAVVTILLSLLAGLVLPRLAPPRDPLSYLQRVRAEVTARQAAARTATAEPAAPGESHTAKPAH